MRKILPLAALVLTASIAHGQQKVSGGGTAPSSDQAVQEKAAAEQSRREAAKKALDALKGQKEQDKGGNKQGGR